MALSTSAPWQLFVFSGVGSCIAEASTVPIDVVKVRLQLQGELGAVRQYHSIGHAVRTIVAKEGVRALYKGLSPALLRQATYGSIRIGLYEAAEVFTCISGVDAAQPVKDLFTPAHITNHKDVPFGTKVAAGVCSGALANGLCCPTDVVKIRMQADGMHGGPPRYHGIVDAFRTIVKTEGFRGLYKGVSPTTQRAAIVAAVELSSYDECKLLLLRYTNWTDGDKKTHFAASLMAGFLATVASSPTDVIKSRVMNQPVGPDGRGLRYKSTIDCFRQSIAAEGVFSLWKGFIPNYARIGPHCVITFLVIEQLRNTFGKK